MPSLAVKVASKARNINLPRVISKTAQVGKSSSSAMTGMALAAGAGAVIGAFGNGGYSPVDSFKGAIAGGLVGGAAGMGLPALARQMTTNKQLLHEAGTASGALINMSKALNSSTGRNALFAAGGGLGGLSMLGSGRDYRRGFNQDRGSRF